MDARRVTAAATKRGEVIARVPVNLAAPGRPCRTCPSTVDDGPHRSVRCGRGMFVAVVRRVAMTHRSYGRWYLRMVRVVGALGRLGDMRARRFELRLLGSALVGAWGLAAVLVLLAYRPGGPLDIASASRCSCRSRSPSAGSCGRRWPAAATRTRWSWPWRRLAPPAAALDRRRAQPAPGARLPDADAVARGGLPVAARAGRDEPVRRLRPRAPDRRGDGAPAAPAARRGPPWRSRFTAVAGTAFAGAAIANEMALRDRTTPPAASRFGPTDAEAELPPCDGALPPGRAPASSPTSRGQIDGGAIGSVGPVRPAGRHELPLARLRGHGPRARPVRRRQLRWPGLDARRRGDGWATADAESVRDADPRPAGGPDGAGPRSRARPRRTAASRSSRARGPVAVASPWTARRSAAAFPQVRWLVGDADLGRWRGQLDYWVFVDGELGQVAGSVNGEAGAIEPEAIQATIEVFLTATERGARPGHLSSGPMTFEDEPERFGKRDRLARMLRVVDRPARLIPTGSGRRRSPVASASRPGPSTATCGRSRRRSASPSGPRAGCGASSARSSCRRSS